MTRQIIIRPTSFDRRQSLLGDQDASSRGGWRLAEVAGGTTAECAAICCCCPCGLADLLFLAVYKVPAGLCRKALRRKRRRRLMEKGLLPREHSRCKCGCDDTELQIHTVGFGGAAAAMVVESFEMDEELIELEKEMWDRFSGTGFWRSFSRRNE